MTYETGTGNESEFKDSEISFALRTISNPSVTFYNNASIQAYPPQETDFIIYGRDNSQPVISAAQEAQTFANDHGYNVINVKEVEGEGSHCQLKCDFYSIGTNN